MSAISVDQERETFTITDDAQADWALDKIAEAQAERDRLQRACQMRIDQFNSKIDEADRAYERDTGYLLSLLSDYFDTVPHKSTKTQDTYSLPSGKLVYKKPSQTAVKDDTALLAWVRVNAPDYVQTVCKAQWGALKKVCKTNGDRFVFPDTGEVVDGVRLEENPARFEVSIG